MMHCLAPAQHPPRVTVQLGGQQNLQSLSLGHLVQVTLAAFPERENAGSRVGYGWMYDGIRIIGFASV